MKYLNESDYSLQRKFPNNLPVEVHRRWARELGGSTTRNQTWRSSLPLKWPCRKEKIQLPAWKSKGDWPAKINDSRNEKKQLHCMLNP
ncbi:hypothetical protein OIU84_021374 [Salix udensis]|uniref:Uncharacterized protein n=1 Tax=Salix udensis TaxID=889485 RepID=A0AAD6KUR0_9ROSI|nr:hypothetical protein OIU84_021374 [Salix udensis]